MDIYRRILLTGFEPFGGHAVNPSQQVVTGLGSVFRSVQIETAVLPVSYAATPRALLRLLDARQWSAVICFGLHGAGAGIRVETLARNRNSSASADNDGVACPDLPIRPDGPEALPATLPSAELLAALEAAGVPAVRSEDAGGYLCNHTLYTLLYELKQRGATTLAGFIHLPPLPDQGAENGMALDRQLQAAQIIVETVVRQLDAAS